MYQREYTELVRDVALLENYVTRLLKHVLPSDKGEIPQNKETVP